MIVSQMAENLIGSEIIKLAGEINQKIRAGEQIYNFTIGDFDPEVFPIPVELERGIQAAYARHATNYPEASGVAELRQAVARYIRREQGLEYSPDDFLVSGGARPLIYAAFQTVVDPEDKVIFPVPSWNNNHYTHLSRGVQVPVETRLEDNFMPTAELLAPHLKDAALLALCSPLNPTGTAFTREALEAICDLVLAENRRRGPGKKPLYVLYDQVYWALTFGDTRHYDPVSLRPEMRDYTLFVDGISKAFAATGVRIGWGFGPPKVINKMKAILSHVGAWPPKAEQIAAAGFLNDEAAVSRYLKDFRAAIVLRLKGIYDGLMQLKREGHAVDAVAPQAAIYLTIQMNLKGRRTSDGRKLERVEDITAYLLDEARLAVVPFYAFGASRDSTWYRLSVGTCQEADVANALAALRRALEKLR